MSELFSLEGFLPLETRNFTKLLRATFSIFSLLLLFLTPSHAGPAMAISGTPTVDKSGQFNYTIPIAVPPGTAGMVPHLALTYSSSNSDGYEGIGWTISGLDKITRCPKEANVWGANALGTHGGVNNDANDGWCYNDSPLLPTNRPDIYGSGTSYDTQAASFIKVIANGTVGDGPSWFQVYLKNGTIIELGNSTDSKIIATGSLHGSVREWLVDKITDVHGNYLTVTYQNDTANGQAYPLHIDYTGTTGASPYNFVKFIYPSSDRPDIVPTYQGGSERRITKLLSDIQTYQGTSLVLDYQLTYRDVTSLPGLHSRLTSLTLCGVGSKCLAPMSFGWQGGTGLGTPTPTTPSYTPLITGDFSGDGLLDILVSGCPTNGAIYNGTATTGSFVTANMTASFAYWGGTYSGPACFTSYLDQIGAGDVDGDGFTDVYVNEHDVHGTDFFSTLVNSQSGALNQYTSGSGLDTSVHWYSVIGDLDGNGLTDNFSQNASGGTPYLNGYLGGYGIFFNPLGSDIGGTGSTYVLTAGDFNGDGCLDILAQGGQIHYLPFCTPASGTGSIPSSCNTGTLIAGDFNGDGNTDIVAVTSSGATLCLSDGLNLTSSSIPSSSTWHNYKIVAGDFDGDGRTDLALLSSSSGSHIIALSTGTGFVTSTFSGSSTISAMVVDANNDGADDLWMTSPTNTIVTFGFQPETMTSVSNGIGATVTASYDRLNKNGSFYTKGSSGLTAPDFALYAIDGPYYVASQMAFSNGVGSAYTNYNLSYTYNNAIGFKETERFAGPKWNILSTRFQTFNQIISTDSRSGLVSTTSYRTIAQLIGFLSSEAITTPGASPVTLSETDTAYCCALGKGNSAAIHVTERDVLHRDLDGAPFPHDVTNYTVDNWNNVTDSNEKIGGIQFREINNYTPYNDKTKWILNQIQQTDVTSTVTNPSPFGVSSIMRSTTFVHDPVNGTGFVTQMDVEPTNAQLHLETDYQYDVFGNKHQTTQLSHDTPVTVPSRTNTVSYDTAGEFPTGNQDALGHASTAAFDPRFGLVTTALDPNGVGPTISYDSLGRVHQTVTADGLTTTTYGYRYCVGVNGGTATCPATGAYVVNASPTTTAGQNGANTSTFYDAFDRVIATDTQGLDGSTIRVSSIYDSSNGLLSQTSKPYFASNPSSAQWTTYIHDALFRVTQATYPDGSQTTYCYHGQTTAVTNALGQTKTTVIDNYGNVSSVTDGQTGTVSSSCVATGGVTTSYLYDAVGDVLQVKDANGNAIQNTYDNLGRKTQSSDPDMGIWTYTYDPLGELIGQVDAKSQSTTITYDKLQRVLLRTETVGATNTYSKWLWDVNPHGILKPMNACTGSASSCLDPSVNTQQKESYDSLSRISQGKLVLDGTTYNYVPTYDPVTGRVASLLYPSGFQADYTYNVYGYLTDITDHASGKVLWHANQADAELHITQQTAGNGVVTTAVYDPQTSRVLNICADTSSGSCTGPVANFSYTWDAIGNMSSRSDTMNGWSEQFCYDGLNRLTVAALNGLCNQPTAKKFFYDALGNLTEKSDVCNTTGCYVYGGTAPHALTSVVGTFGGITNPTFDYDANGNMVCEHTGAHCNMGSTVQAVTYTPFNMAATVATGGTTMGLDYRADRARYKMCVPGCSGTPTSTTFYLYDPATGGMSEKLVSGGSTTWTDYVLSPEGHIVATRTKASGAPSWNYTVVDNLGSTVSMTDSHTPTANVIERDSYDPWGKRRNPLTGADVACGSITSATTRGYTGHEMLDSQCLINMNARLYDPSLGRFQSADSMVPDPLSTQSYNRYSYVENNPLNSVDPTGHIDCGADGQLPCENTSPEAGGGQYSTDDTDDGWNPNDYGHGPDCYSCSTAGIPSNILSKSDPGSHAVNRDGKIVSVSDKPARDADQQSGMWRDSCDGAADSSSPNGETHNSASAGSISYHATEEGPDLSSGGVPVWVVTATFGKLTYLYRTVDMRELESLVATGMRFVPSPNGSEVKYFWTDPVHAVAFGKSEKDKGPKWLVPPFHVVVATIPSELLTSDMTIALPDIPEMGRVQAIALPNELLPNVSPAVIVGGLPTKGGGD